MITLLVTIPILIGSWYTWRRNPMYSRRRTLHFILATALSIAAIIGLIVAAIQLTQGQSDAVQIGAILVTVLLSTIVLIWVIVSITTPKASALPAGTRMATLHRRRLIPWLKRMLWTLAVLGLLALVPGPRGGFNWVQFIALFLGAWVLGLGLILLAAGYIGGRTLDRALTGVLANPWLHWTYTPAEWSSFINIQILRAQAREQKKALDRRVPKWVILPVVGIPVFIGSYFAGILTLWINALISAAFASLIFGLVALSDRNTANAPQRLRRRLVAAQPEAWLGPDGLFANGEYQPWVTTGIYLVEAVSDAAQPRSLYFRFEKIQPGNSVPVSTYIHQYVFIPSSLDQTSLDTQLAALQRDLSAVARTASVRIA